VPDRTSSGEAGNAWRKKISCHVEEPDAFIKRLFLAVIFTSWRQPDQHRMSRLLASSRSSSFFLFLTPVKETPIL
jgi:hypothetical protein